MKNITKLLSIVIVALGISFTSFANATFMPTDKYNFGGTVFDPLGSRLCSYEIYCDGPNKDFGFGLNNDVDNFNYQQSFLHFPENYPRIQY